jgi:hypothetical protein
MSDKSDTLDVASRVTEEFTERQIAAARRAANVEPAPMPEFCLNDCGEKPRERSRYCSIDCREDHELRQRQQKRAGRA